MRIGHSWAQPLQWIAALLVAAGPGCKREAPPPARDVAATQAAPAQAAPPEAPSGSAELTEKAAIAIGDRAATAVLSGLLARVKKAMQEGGPEHAIDFCSETALPLTAEIAESQDHKVEIKRTSSRVRNPKNEPDALEKQALEHFEREATTNKKIAPDLVQKVDGGYRYNRPIVVMSACLACHGEQDAIAPTVRKKLQERYPNDRATGYKEGDLRGLIRVNIPATPSQGD